MIEITREEFHAFIQEALDAGGSHKATGVFVRARCSTCHTSLDALDWRFARCPKCGPIDTHKDAQVQMKSLH